MPSTLEKKTFFTVGLFSIITLIIIAAIIWPTVSYITRLNQDTADLRMYLEKKYESTKNFRTNIKRVEEIKNEIIDYPDYSFKPGDELALITSLENIAAEEKVSQKIISSNLDKITNNQVNIQLSTAGSYQQNLNYLNRLEKMGYFINLEEINFTPIINVNSTNSTSTPTNLDLKMSIYAIQ